MLLINYSAWVQIVAGPGFRKTEHPFQARSYYCIFHAKLPALWKEVRNKLHFYTQVLHQGVRRDHFEHIFRNDQEFSMEALKRRRRWCLMLSCSLNLFYHHWLAVLRKLQDEELSALSTNKYILHAYFFFFMELQGNIDNLKLVWAEEMNHQISAERMKTIILAAESSTRSLLNISGKWWWDIFTGWICKTK